jgi:opacity protein-like surface antigen
MDSTAKARRVLIIRIGWMSCVLAAYTTVAIAQTTARVTRDQSTIWAPGFQTVASVVKTGTVLTVVGRRGDWYEVVVPGSDRASDATTGFIFKSNVDVETGPAPSSAPPGPATAPPPPSGRSRPIGTRPSPDRSRAIGVLGFGQFGYTRFSAHQSFAAVLGQSGGTLFGGGAEVRLGRGLFVNASIERFTDTGQRVFVLDGQVFKLGIPDTITLTPVALTTGWRFVNDRATPYVGAGIGRVFYKETSSFADATENVDARFTSYQVLGGVEFRNGWVATAFEVQYSRVPNAIGIGGASAAFQESNLGGLGARIKILVGR